MKLHLIDSNTEVALALGEAFAPFPEVEVREGDLLAIARECVVSPANSYGYMDGGFERALYEYFGPSIQTRVQDAIHHRQEGHLPVGASMLVRTGHTVIPYLLVVPTVTLPDVVDALNAYRAMRAMLRIASTGGVSFTQVFCPGLTTGVGGVPASEAAAQMAAGYRDAVSQLKDAPRGGASVSGGLEAEGG